MAGAVMPAAPPHTHTCRPVLTAPAATAAVHHSASGAGTSHRRHLVPAGWRHCCLPPCCCRARPLSRLASSTGWQGPHGAVPRCGLRALLTRRCRRRRRPSRQCCGEVSQVRRAVRAWACRRCWCARRSQTAPPRLGCTSGVCVRATAEQPCVCQRRTALQQLRKCPGSCYPCNQPEKGRWRRR